MLSSQTFRGPLALKRDCHAVLRNPYGSQTGTRKLRTMRGKRCHVATSQREGTREKDTGADGARPEAVPVHNTALQEKVDAEDDFTPITAMWARNAQQYGDLVALQEHHRSPAVSMTYRELNEVILNFAAGLKAHGLQQGDKVCLFAESSSRWIVADQATLMNGAADAVRGSSSPLDELAYIITHCGASALVLQDRATLLKLMPSLMQPGQTQRIKFVALLWDDEPTATTSASSSSNGAASSGQLSEYELALRQLTDAGVPVLGYGAVLASGAQLRAVGPFQPASCGRKSLATLVYTSGTTGHPKAVCLSHGNLAYQVDNLDYFLQVSPGDSTLSLLPPWHIYQRTAAYYLFSRGAREVFTTLRSFRDDLTAHPPDHFVCVPLVLDTLYNKVMAKLQSDAKGVKGAIVAGLMAASNAFILARRLVQGVDLRYAVQGPSAGQKVAGLISMALLAPLYALAQRLVFSKVRAALGIKKTVVSGGGSLASHLDLFFEAVGLPVLNGWGLTETSPVLACRRSCANVRGSVGLPTPGTQVIVVHPVTHNPLPDGQQGLLLAAGPGVMAGGYLGDPEATRRAFIDGWYDTGDLGWRAPAGVAGSAMAGHIVLNGRAKDTIVLLSGKNIEPQPIEDALQRSSYIKHVVLLGQDKRELGALVFPDEEVLSGSGPDRPDSQAGGNEPDGLEALLLREVRRHNTDRPDYHHEDHIAHIQVIRAPLSVESGTLTRTMKPRRPVIKLLYSKQVEQLMHKLRG